jgi:predicted hotdog family 3-hydroxylacyl-ACP dehydratase
MTDHPPIAALIPHQGAMCLNERVVAFDATRVTLATTTHRSPDNPLRRNGRLGALHLGEYGAQAMAVHGGLLAHAAGHAAPPGMLVALRAVTFAEPYIDELDGELIVEAEQLIAGDDSWQYQFRVSHGERVIAEGRAAVVLRVPTVAGGERR